VRAADAAVRLGPAPAAESYLNIPRLLEAAATSGATAIHPGYGFLAERAAFAEAVEGARLVWIGPPPAAIRAMGDKTEARQRMQAAGVPIVPGAVTPVADLKAARVVAEEVGFPLMVKATAGGGGKGMRVVRAPGELRGALEAAASEAQKAFGDPAVYLEKFVERPRHVEIQVLADHARTIHLGERECSVQRRHQKLVEEAPSVAVTPELREWMGAAAVAAAEAVGYRGAGTCEFLLAADGAFYFLEMNTRIQVEHPVTELVYGVDLVREQLRIARGEPMSVPATFLHPRGWAMECRITAEDPATGFLPATGRISYLRAPNGPGVRWDSGVDVGSEVTLFYDSLLAKLIVWAPSRPQAIERMRRALDELQVAGIATNQAFHRRLFRDPGFCAGDIDIQLLDRRPELLALEDDPALVRHLAIAAALAEDAARGRRAPPPDVGSGGGESAWLHAARRDGVR
jgi:acetyl-CoA carboxylase biotin carboxylase subunit